MTLHLSQSCQSCPPFSYTHTHTHTLTHTSRGAAAQRHGPTSPPNVAVDRPELPDISPCVFFFFYRRILLGVYPRAWKAQCHSVKEGYMEKDRWSEKQGGGGERRERESRWNQEGTGKWWDRERERPPAFFSTSLRNLKSTSDHPLEQTTFLYFFFFFFKRSQIIVFYVFVFFSLPRSIDRSERMTNRWTVIPLWDFYFCCLSNLSHTHTHTHTRTHTHTHTHTGSLVIINDSMMYRDLMDERSVLSERVWLHKKLSSLRSVEGGRRNVDAGVCLQTLFTSR